MWVGGAGLGAVAETHAQDGDAQNIISGVERMEGRDIFCKRNSKCLRDTGS